MDYFTVSGEAPREITLSIRDNSPERGKKTFAAAQTRSPINYEITWEELNSRCTLSSVTIYLDLTYISPQLSRTPKDKATRQWWRSELASYKEHELTHGDIAKELAHKLDQELMRIGDLECSVMEEKIKRRVNYYSRIIQKNTMSSTAKTGATR